MRIAIIIFIQVFSCVCCFSQKQQKSIKSKLPEFLIDSFKIGEGSFFTELESYIRNKIGIKDSIMASNGIEGEAYQASTTFHLKGGHTYTTYSEWEASSIEMVFLKIKQEEVIKLVLGILKQVGKFNPELPSLLATPGLHYISIYDEECCYFKIEEINKKTYLGIGY